MLHAQPLARHAYLAVESAHRSLQTPEHRLLSTIRANPVHRLKLSISEARKPPNHRSTPCRRSTTHSRPPSNSRRGRRGARTKPHPAARPVPERRGRHPAAARNHRHPHLPRPRPIKHGCPRRQPNLPQRSATLRPGNDQRAVRSIGERTSEIGLSFRQSRKEAQDVDGDDKLMQQGGPPTTTNGDQSRHRALPCPPRPA